MRIGMPSVYEEIMIRAYTKVAKSLNASDGIMQLTAGGSKLHPNIAPNIASNGNPKPRE